MEPRLARAVYVHIPFCRRRCGYCNFALTTDFDRLVERYLAAVERELASFAPQEVDTLFFGGGTPTQLPVDAFDLLCERLLAKFSLTGNYEWSVEANPADLTAEYAALLKRLGVNRISLGAQSFHAPTLQALERDHSPDDVRRAAERVRPFSQLSLDLIFAAPGQQLEDWRLELNSAIALKPDHISTYGLTFEKGTAFWNRARHGQMTPCSEELEKSMYELAMDRLALEGFAHYEVSNFARPGAVCRHNENYWLGGNYHALGPSAASHYSGLRSVNHRSVYTYLKWLEAGRSPIAEQERLAPEERARERLVFGLRRMAGVSRSLFADATGFSLDDLAGPVIREYVMQGLLADDGETVRLTRKGLLVSDALWPRMLMG